MTPPLLLARLAQLQQRRADIVAAGVRSSSMQALHKTLLEGSDNAQFQPDTTVDVSALAREFSDVCAVVRQCSRLVEGGAHAPALDEALDEAVDVRDETAIAHRGKFEALLQKQQPIKAAFSVRRELLKQQRRTAADLLKSAVGGSCFLSASLCLAFIFFRYS